MPSTVLPPPAVSDSGTLIWEQPPSTAKVAQKKKLNQNPKLFEQNGIAQHFKPSW